MTVQDLIELLEYKISTGEINRLDDIFCEGEDSETSDWAQLLDVRSANTSCILTVNATFE